MKIEIDLIYIHALYIEIHGTMKYTLSEKPNTPYIMFNGTKTDIHTYYKISDCKNESVYRFIYLANLSNLYEKYTLYFIANDGKLLKINKFNKFSPISLEYPYSYYAVSNWILQYSYYGHLYLYRYKLLKHIKLEILFCINLISNKQFASVLVRMFYYIFKVLQKKEVWIIYDRINRADDNGEAFFKYLQKLESPHFKSYFILSKESTDYNRIKKIGKVIPFFSIREKFLFLICKYKISSHADHYTTYPLGSKNLAFKDLLQSQKFIFLQHGVIKDDLSNWLNRYNRKIYGLVTCALKEKKSIIQLPYEYENTQIWLTGLPRHDYLYHDEKKLIVIMPTWRKYLLSDEYSLDGTRKLKPDFTESDFYVTYNSLLSSSRLKKILFKFGYIVAVMPHPMMEQYIEKFPLYDEVQYFSSLYSYCDIYAKANLLITDYSSSVFDFALLKKPIIYFQFDKDMFFSGAHTFTKGYFDYEKMGFGEIKTNVSELIDSIEHCLQNNCEMPPFYQKRVDSFFYYNDKNNCERLYQKITEIG